MSRVLILLFVLLVWPVAGQSQAPTTPSSPASPAVTAAPAQRADAIRPSPGTPAPIAALTDEQKTIYAVGLLMQRSIRQLDLSPDEIEVVMRALTDAAAGRPAVDLNEWGPRIQPFATARGLRMTTREKANSAAYLDAAAGETGAVKTASGLVYRDITAGTGASPTASDTVRVNYRGTLINGTVFDSSYDRNEPAEFALGAVIPCWTEGVQRMRVGGKARLVCGSDLAYGDAGAPTIPGGAALIFEVELLEIVRPAARPLGAVLGR